MPIDRVEVAFHEAGHTVAHLVVGVPFKFVTIEAKGSILGRVEPSDQTYQELLGEPDRPVDSVEVERHILVSLAGDLAQEKFAGREVDGWDDDHKSAFSLAMMIGDPEEIVNRLIHQCEHQLLPTHWPSVKSVAEALLERTTLTQAEVVSLVGTLR